MRVQDVMTRDVEFVHPSITLEEAAARMKALHIGPLPVCDKGWVLGMLTDRDITARGVAEGKDPRVIRSAAV